MKKIWMAWGLMAMVHVAQADLIARWQNDPFGGNEISVAPATLGSNMDAALLARGAGGTATIYTNTFAMRNAHSELLSQAVTSNRYLTITLEADTGYQMNLTNIFIRLQAQNATDYEVNFTLMSDATGFTPGDEIVTWVVGGTGNSSDWLGQPRSHDLSGIAELQNITDVEFRLYIWGQQGGAFAQTGIGRAFATNGDTDLEITGNVEVIPEPGTLALLGIGLLSILYRRFKRA